MPSATKLYIVTAYRWGLRDNHSYVVGVYDSQQLALADAETHVGWRGGKYGCEVMELEMNADQEKRSATQVGYFESPYFGMACRNVPSYQPAQYGKEPIKHQHHTVREELFKAEREIAELMRKLAQYERENAELLQKLKEARLA